MRIKNKADQKSFADLFDYSQKYLPYRLLSKMGFKNVDTALVSEASILYSTMIFLHAIVFFTAYFYRDFGETLFFMLFLLITVVGAVLGGKIIGILSAFFALFEVTYLFLNPRSFLALLSPHYLVNYLGLLVCGIMLSYFIDWIRKSKEISLFKKREREYARNFVHLNEELKKAKREIKARDEFLSLASHELKTPLTTMLLKLHNMLHTVRNVSLANFSVPALMKVLENAQQQTRRLSNMINDLLNVSLITTGRLKLDREDTDLVGVVKNVLENFSEILKNEKYKVQFDSGKKIVGRWDKNRIEQAVTNLVSNAIKYGEGNPIEIKLENTNSYARFIIHDHGIGISKDDQKILFERFSRSLTSQDYKKGLGVGLYITYQIIKAHKGSVKVMSKLKKGSTFVVDLPMKAS